jgi:membrane associated rhomboid family serine protease
MTAQYGERVPDSQASVCYRHSDRQSFVLCQRCGKTICGECQTPAAVGVICPDCAAEARQSAAKPRAFGARVGESTPVVTYGIMLACALVFAGQWLTQTFAALPSVTQALWYAPAYSLPQAFEPWRMMTSVFTHSPSFFLHILLNMYTLWLFGRQLEQFLGRGRYLALYLISGFSGSLFVMFWAYAEPQSLLVPVVGASGAIFGLLGAFLVIGRHMGGNMRTLLVLLAINLAIGFLPGASISWQAHVGGLISGAVVALIFVRTRLPRQQSRQRWMVAGYAAALAILSLSFFVVIPVGVFA